MKTVIVILLAAVTSLGCASSPYVAGTGRADIDGPLAPPMETQVLVGEPHGLLDASDWIWPGSLFGKLILWDRDVDSHEISEETIRSLEGYLARNEMSDVQVLVNRYDPGNQWRRLTQNKTVAAGWRYTLGTLTVLFYTVVPGRFFGGDAYNPYTNTVYLYSDDPSIALHEAGHAKDFARREDKGNYAALYLIPFVPLWHEAQATGDALGYLAALDDADGQRAAYEILYPAYGTYVAGILGALGGHVVGQSASGSVEDAAPRARDSGRPSPSTSP